MANGVTVLNTVAGAVFAKVKKIGISLTKV